MEKKQKNNKKTDINEMLLQGFLHINNRMRALYEGKASQKRILIVLSEQDNMTMNQKKLTKYLGIQPGSASEILSKLEKTDMITRRQSEKDRRTMEIILTDKGIETAKIALKERKKRHIQMFECLTQEEKKQLLTTLQKIDKDWENRFAFDKEDFRNVKLKNNEQ